MFEDMSTHDPRAEYERRLEERLRLAARTARDERALSNARLAWFLLAALSTGLALGPKLFSPIWLVLPLAVFVAVVVLHLRTRGERERAERAARFYGQGLGRLSGEWIGHGDAGERYLDPDHLYAGDLDLFGRGSLFELLSVVRTRMGEDVLAEWLTHPAGPDEIRARQGAVEELRGQLDLREDLALLGPEVRGGLDPKELAAWGGGELWRIPKAVRVAVATLTAATSLVVLALSGYATDLLTLSPTVAAALVRVLLLLSAAQAAVAYRFRSRVQRVTAAVGRPDKDLAILSEILIRIEGGGFRSPRLARLVESLRTEGVPPSRRIAQLHTRVEWLDSEKNQIVAPLRPILLLSTQIAFSIEVWRARCGPALAGWLQAAAEFEALLALASYAYEHPRDPFPEILSGEPRLEAEGIAHPLIPEARAVANDVALGGELRLLVVSGSNMSGKSTFLRTVGTNAVLAFAGAPVRARRLALTPLEIGASIRIADSLLAGHSRFYAEITRLRAIVELAERSHAALFLLDEIFAGTNSHDRRIGAEAVLKGLVARGAIGFVTTHDLALARIVDELAPRAANVHFVDHIEDGKMVFDYQVRQGVVQKSNALELMRAVGLEV